MVLPFKPLEVFLEVVIKQRHRKYVLTPSRPDSPLPHTTHHSQLALLTQLFDNSITVDLDYQHPHHDFFCIHCWIFRWPLTVFVWALRPFERTGPAARATFPGLIAEDLE